MNPTEPSVAEPRLERRFKQLHRRLYEVYSLDALDSVGPIDSIDPIEPRDLNRDAIHDLLAASFSGEALTDEYVEHFVTLTRMRQERTAIDVVRVEIVC